MWIVTGPRSIVPVWGDGIEPRTTARHSAQRPERLPAEASLAMPTERPYRLCRCGRLSLDQDLDRELVRAAERHQPDLVVQGDVVAGGQGNRIRGRVARADQLLRSPVLDTLHLGLA